ncbi:MAG TPA: phytoene/squalene synthase family protein [Hyphomicrobiaceae bacterium]|nr:phytoene/squalene synthase family protein [Hyphomicrobiaceae bacterium]
MDVLLQGAVHRISVGSKSFAAAARLLPPDKRASVRLLYTWCRHCDDAIDGETLGFRAAPDHIPPGEHLARLVAGTDLALNGRSTEPEFRALERVVAEHAIPARYPRELLAGMEMDVRGDRFQSIEDTLSYCYHVAGVVGVMIAIILDARDGATLERASDLGIAFQLTNIARDIVADAERGRVYLPSTWLAVEGLTTETILDQERRGGLFKVAQRLLSLSDGYYESAVAGIARLPFRSAFAIATARRVYRRIGTRILEQGATSWDQRIATSRREKAVACVLAMADVVALNAIPDGSARPRDGLWTPQGLIA